LKQKKILHIIKGLGRGGAERLLVSTIRQHNKEYHFDVVYYLPNKSHLAEELRSLGCTVLLIPSPNVWLMLLQLPVLIRFIRQNQYDLLHAHLPWSGIMARMAGKITNVPVVYTEHNLFNRYNVVTRLISKLTFSWQKHVIAVSARVKETLQQQVQPSVPVRVIMNGVDVGEFRREGASRQEAVGKGSLNVGNKSQAGGINAEGFFNNEQRTINNDFTEVKMNTIRRSLGLPEQAMIIGTVTALTEQKRIDRWIEVATAVARECPEVYFVIVGDGLLREALHQQGERLVKQKKLLFAGMTANPAQWLSCVDIFLMTSDFEGLPVALLEAMSMECVPVVTNVGGIPTVITEGDSGFMFDPESIDTAVEKIQWLAASPELRRKMGVAARKVVVEKFSVVRMVAELEEVYRDVLRQYADRNIPSP